MSSHFSDHFSAVAARYADFRPNYPAALFEYVATLVPADSVVWDCAAGNGQASVDLGRRFRKVIATDASREQIASAPALANVEFRVARAEESGLPDASVDLVTVAQALHWFDLARFYDEARRVLRPGGALAVWCYGVEHVDGAAVDRLAQDYYSNTVGPYWPPERRLVEESYGTIPFPFAEVEAPSIEMEAFWTLDQLLGYFSTWSATSRFIKANGFNPLDALARDLRDAWGDPNRKRRIAWPLSLRVGRA
jgi:SAM-dependent methyltransferase